MRTKIIVRHCTDVLLATKITSTLREFNKLYAADNRTNTDEYWRKRVEQTMLTIVQHSFAYLVPK